MINRLPPFRQAWNRPHTSPSILLFPCPHSKVSLLSCSDISLLKWREVMGYKIFGDPFSPRGHSRLWNNVSEPTSLFKVPPNYYINKGKQAIGRKCLLLGVLISGTVSRVLSLTVLTCRWWDFTCGWCFHVDRSLNMQTMMKALKERKDTSLTNQIKKHVQVRVTVTEKNKDMEKNIKLKWV